MRLFLDWDTRSVTASRGGKIALASLPVAFLASEPCEVEFTRNGAAWRPDAGALSFVAKSEGEFDAEPWAEQPVFTRDDSGGRTAFVASIAFDSTAIASALAADADSENDEPTARLVAEFSFATEQGEEWRSRPFAIVVENSVGREGDMPPTGAQAAAALGARFLPFVTSFTELAAFESLGWPTNQLFAFYEAATDLLRFVLLRAGTEDTDLPNITRPSDFHGTTNARVYALAAAANKFEREVDAEGGIDNRIAELPDATGRTALFSTYNVAGGVYTANVDFWGAGLDFSGVSVSNNANLDGTGGNRGGVTMLSPRHFVSANHFYPSPGTVVRFVDSGGTIVTRTISSTVQIGTSDIRIGVLDSDLPGTVAFYPILPDSYAATFASYTKLPIVGINQDRVAYVREWSLPSTSFVNHVLPATAPRSTFGGAFITGDSGQPLFLIVGNELIALTTHFFAASGPALAANVAAINAAMTTLGGGYQLTLADWTDWLDIADPVLTFGGTRYLREDGEWAEVEGGSGDSLPDQSGHSGQYLSTNGTTAAWAAVTKTTVGLANVDNTSDAGKPVSTAQQAALDLKAAQSAFAAHLADTANPHATTKAQVGLGSVDNTADSAKPVSTAQAAADAVVLASAATDATTKANAAQAAAIAASQPLDADLTAIAALTTASAGRSLLTLASVPTGALVGTSDTQALTGKTVNGLTITTSTGTLTVANGKILTASNTLTLAGTDGSTLNVGTGGTLGTAAFTASTAYQPADAALTALAAGSDFVQFTGPATSTKTFTLPNVSSTLLYDAGPLGTPSSGTLTNATGLPAGGLTASAASVLFGRYAGTAGAGQQITIGTGLALNTGTGVLSATGGSGTIASTKLPLKGDNAGNAVAVVVQTMGDADTTVTAGTNIVRLTTALTADRVLTLPAASGYTAGDTLTVIDVGGYVGSGRKISIARAGSDTINGGTANRTLLEFSYGRGYVTSDGTSQWMMPGQITLYNVNTLSLDAYNGKMTVFGGYFGNSAAGVLDVWATTAMPIRFGTSNTLRARFSDTAPILVFGTSSDAGVGWNAAGVIEINSGTAGTYRDLLARGLRSNAVAFASAIASPVEGTIQAFTDSSTSTWGATITGGGANHVLGYYNGTNWTVMAK